jgi:uncharacterized membrane protein HdeD (DUF308 family)
MKLNPTKRNTLKYHLNTFDFLGLFLLVSGIVLILVGFNSSETSWQLASTIAPLVIGCLLFLSGIASEFFTKRSPVLPPRLFKTRTTAALLIGVFIHGITFFAGTY